MLGWLGWASSATLAADAPADRFSDAPISPELAQEPSFMSDLPTVNLKLKTLGGRQFWGDVANFRNWRIQQNIITQHYRLIDPDDVRHAWGTLDHCREQLDSIRKSAELRPLSGRAVILIHGIIRSSKSFARLQERLEADDCIVVSFDYPSTRVTIPESAAYLKRVIDSLEGVESIDLVVHSLGGLIVRSYLSQTADKPDPRLHRMVMLGVPNHGARMASVMKDNVLFKAIFGPAGQQLVEDPDGVIAALPTPAFPFAIVAGARGTEEGYNPVIPGDDDGIVSVDCTRLAGAADFLKVDCIHSFLPLSSDALDAAVRFLETGALRSDGKPRPIPLEEQASAPRPTRALLERDIDRFGDEWPTCP
jgi:pimeloyl-ACP methyl ester carboxylesterase